MCRSIGLRKLCINPHADSTAVVCWCSVLLAHKYCRRSSKEGGGKRAGTVRYDMAYMRQWSTYIVEYA